MKQISIILTLLVLVGCAEQPISLIKEVQTTRERYRNSDSYDLGVELFEQALDTIAYQNLKFALFRNYDQSIYLLKQADSSFKSNIPSQIQSNVPNISTFKLDDKQFETLIQTLRSYH